MSSSQQTTNLGLPIYGDSDVPSWKDTNTPFQTLDDIIGQGGSGGSQVQLDWAHPLHAFTSGNTSWTATQDCYLAGTATTASGIQSITIDNNIIYTNYEGSEGVIGLNVYPIRVKKGSVITTSRNMDTLKCYPFSVVSSEVTVFNEAEVELDYGNPIHTISGSATYTAETNGYLVGFIYGGGGGISSLSINGTTVAKTVGESNIFDGACPIPIYKVQQGDVIVTTGNSTRIHLLRGTISGSVGQIGEPPSLNYTTPLHQFTNSALTYTATKTCYLFGEFECSTTGNAYLAINGNQMYHTRWSAENCPIPLNIKLTSGDSITITKTSTISETLYILETL